MGKGSQLAQLKSALSNAGISGPKPSKKRKRSTPLEKDKEKKVAKLEEIHRRLNPFDTKVTKLKHDIGGRKLKGVTGKPAKSKQAGLERRQKTLLKEYAEKDRAGGVVDRRFGENDPTMSLEEKMLERFTKERQRSSAGAAFMLEDEDDLTHYGQSLSKLDDFDDVGLHMDSDEEEDYTSGQISRNIVSRTHFGGFGEEHDEEEEDGQPPRKKSKAEVMAELIAKSKEHKLRRQMDKDKADELRHDLDNEFSSLRDLLFAPVAASQNGDSLPAEPQPTTSSKDDTAITKLTEKHTDYDQHVRELAFDKRAKPKDRTKTEEELALEQKEALEKAERRRQRRMLGQPESDSEDESRPKGKRKRSGDDLDDDFEELGGWEGLGTGLGEETKSDSAADEDEGDSDESEEEEAGSGEEEGEGEEAEDEIEDESESESEEEIGEHELLVDSTRKLQGKSKADGKKPAKHQLPFTFPCPETHEEFLDIIEDIEDGDVPTVVQRIRTLFHTSLAAENKFKLQNLGKLLIDHILFVAAEGTPSYSLIDALFSHICAITKTYPIPIAQHFNEKLALMHKNLKRGLSRGALNPGSKTWPGLSELSLLRLIALIWPTSDLNHAVISPTRILMGAYLGLGRVRLLRDIASGLFLCSLWLQFEQLSRRLVPEAINFLLNAVLHLAPHTYNDVSQLPSCFPSPDFRSEPCQSLRMNSKLRKTVVPQKPNLGELLASEEPTEQQKADLLSVALGLLGRFAELYKGLEAFIELYEPALAVLEKVESRRLPEHHRTELQKLVDMLQRLLKFARQGRKPLRLQTHKPIPIPTYVPKFETTNSSYLRRQDPDHEANQLSKLRNQYKQERKGAIRELRKDARFLAAVQQKEQISKDKTYNERIRRVFGSIEGERAEQKQMEKDKAKEKRRAGGKR